MQIVESSSLVSVLDSSLHLLFFHLLVNGFFLLLVSVLLKTPYLFIILVGGIGGRGGIKMASAKNNQLISSQRPHFSPRSTAKPTIKVPISGRMASIGLSDVLTTSEYSEKTRMKKLMMMKMIIIIIIIIITRADRHTK